MTNDSYLFLRLDIDPSASSGESCSASHRPLEEIFQVAKPRWKTKQCTWVLTQNGENTHWHTCTQTCVPADETCLTSLPPFCWTYGNVSASQEMFANVRTCGRHGPRPHEHSVQLCQGLLANPCTPPCVPPSASTPRRETNCERYWLPRQICTVQRVNKMDGVVRLSSGKVFWQHASGRVQHSSG